MADAAAPSLGRVFISYRREETAYAAGWLFDRLEERFGRDQIFKDIDSVQLGDDFVEVISAAVGSCDVLLVLIGDRWLTMTDAQGRARLDNPDDFVRLEIEAALARNVRVIPILVEGAPMPSGDELPASLSKLTRRQALELSPRSFEFDTSRLLKVLERTLAEVHPQPTVAEPDATSRVHPPSVEATSTPSSEVAALEQDRVSRKRRRLLTWAGVGAVVIVAVVIAVLVLLPSDGSRGTDRAGRTVEIAGNQQWTDTHVECKVGDVLDILGTGMIFHEPGSPVDPNGLVDPSFHQFNVAGLPDANTAALIGKISGEQPFFVGTGTSHECRGAGFLLLGINDVGLSNNSGAFNATIKLRPR
jgi:TIR domain